MTTLPVALHKTVTTVTGLRYLNQRLLEETHPCERPPPQLIVIPLQRKARGTISEVHWIYAAIPPLINIPHNFVRNER